MFNFHSSKNSQLMEDAGEIEQYRARHRRTYRGPQPPIPQVENLGINDERTRKISAKWRRQQPPQGPFSNQSHDNAELHEVLNAFDYSASPEAFQETQQRKERKVALSSCQDSQQPNDATDNSASLWNRRFPNLQQPGGSVRQLPTLGEDALWESRAHYPTHDAKRQALYNHPQYFA